MQNTPARCRKWSTMSTGSLRGHEGQPLVIGDMMHLRSSCPSHVYAVRLKDPGRMVWSFTPDQNQFAPSVACCDVVNRGPACGKGMMFANALHGMMCPRDAKAEQVNWKVGNADPMPGQTMTMAPLVVKDKVITGVSGAEYGVHGYITACDIDTGKPAWRAYSTGPDDKLMFNPATGATHKPVGRQGLQPEDLERPSVETRRRHDLAAVAQHCHGRAAGRGSAFVAGSFEEIDIRTIYDYVQARQLDLIPPGRPSSGQD
jgi:Glucose dehydrogenase